MTTSVNTKHSAKMDESRLSFNPTAVVRPTTSAVCDDGIPPLPLTEGRTLKLQSRLEGGLINLPS